MENESADAMKKRMKTYMQEKEIAMMDEAVANTVGEDAEANVLVSEQVELEIANILEKINRFTQQVSELLESGKSLLKDLTNEFEERMILIHKEQMEKWQNEIKELRLLDASNEESDALLQNARYLLQNVRSDS